MTPLYLERSTGECRDGNWVEALDLDGVERIVVGTGPGSFAGIRSALAFAQGYSLGTKCEVLGLPSACACAAQVLQAIKQSSNPNNRTIRLAVIGDARQGKAWIALFDGFRQEQDVFQVNQVDLKGTVPADCLGDATRGTILDYKIFNIKFEFFLVHFFVHLHTPFWINGVSGQEHL